MHGRVPLPQAPPRRRSFLSGFGLRVHLGVLVAVALLPALALSALAFRDGAQSYRQATDARLLGTARAVAEVVAHDLAVQVALVQAMRGLPELDDPYADLTQLDALVRRLAAPVGGWVVVADPGTSRQIINTRFPPGAPLPPAWGPGPMREQVLAERSAVISNLVASPNLPFPVLGVMQSTHGGHWPARIVGLYTEPHRQRAMLGQVQIAPGGLATLLDGEGRVIARSLDHERWVGRLSPTWTRAAARGSDVVRTSSLDGRDMLAANVPVDGSPDWAVVVAEPWQRFATLRNTAFAKLFFGALASLLLGLALVGWYARRIVRPVEAMASEVEADTGSGPVALARPVVPSGIREIDALAAQVAAARDTLQRRAAEAEEQAALIGSVLDNTDDVVFAKDANLRFVLANRAMLHAMGLRAEQLVGRRSVELLPRALAERIEAHDREVMQSGKVTPYEITIPGATGVRTYLTVKCAWRDGAGRLIGMVGVSRDITGARLVEQRLASAQARLLQVSRLGATGAMAAGLAHEINQPLTAASNYAGAAARLLGEPGAPPPSRLRLEEVRRVLPSVVAQAQRAGAILTRLRGFISDGSSELSMEPLEEVVRDAAAMMAATLAREDAELVLDIRAPLGSASIDRVQLQQVLFNLLRNAAEALHDAPRRTVRVSAWRAGPGAAGALLLEVADSGPGLPQEVMANLFEPFVTTKTDGLGVGLAICRRAVEAQGGTLEAARAPEGGALFRIMLPDSPCLD